MKNGFATENDWYVKNFISGNIFVIRTSFCCLRRGFVQKDIMQDREKSILPMFLSAMQYFYCKHR